MKTANALQKLLVGDVTFGPVTVRIRRVANVMWLERDGFARTRELPTVGEAIDYAHRVKARLEIDAYVEEVERRQLELPKGSRT